MNTTAAHPPRTHQDFSTYTLCCSHCGRSYDPLLLQTFAHCDDCGQHPLRADYVNATLKIDTGNHTLWRYRQLLPVQHEENIVSLGEGWTPVYELKNLGRQLGLEQLFLKDESFNPTGSFKARGMSVAVSKAKELGVRTAIVPTAGNAGGALSAYCAKAGIHCVVVMPTHTPIAFQKECKAFGAELMLEDGLIADCARKVAQLKKGTSFFDFSTMKEPFRLEGKKTMGYEIWEQLKDRMPRVILYPAGGGTGLIGIWKAFHELMAMGYMHARELPRMIAVQTDRCQPLVDTWRGLQPNAAHYIGRATVANGLAVPNPFAEKWMLEVLNQSGGCALSVSEEAIQPHLQQLAGTEGILAAPEGAVLLAAVKMLLKQGEIQPDQRILLLNTGSGYKYLENFEF